MIAFRGKKKGCATPKMVSFRISYEHPRPFHMGVPTPPAPGYQSGSFNSERTSKRQKITNINHKGLQGPQTATLIVRST